MIMERHLVARRLSWPVRKSTSELGYLRNIAEAFVNLHAIEAPRSRERRRVDGLETPRHRAGVASMAWRATHDAATASGPLRRRRRAARGAAAAARGVPARGDGVGGTAGAPRPRSSVTDHPTPPFSNFHQYSRIPTPTRSEWPQNRKRNHPRPRLLDTTPVDVMTMAWRSKAP